MTAGIIHFIQQALPFFVVLSQALSLLLLASILVFVFSNKVSRIVEFAGKRAIFFSLVAALAATLGSLFYSEVVGFVPCELCWYQRILMYPQALILAVALWKNERGVAAYVLPMSVIGIFVSSYHYLLQIGVFPAPSCSAVGFSVSCAQTYTMAFGYITIPMMALSAFLNIAFFFLAQEIYLRKVFSRQSASKNPKRPGMYT